MDKFTRLNTKGESVAFKISDCFLFAVDKRCATNNPHTGLKAINNVCIAVYAALIGALVKGHRIGHMTATWINFSKIQRIKTIVAFHGDGNKAILGNNIKA